MGEEFHDGIRLFHGTIDEGTKSLLKRTEDGAEVYRVRVDLADGSDWDWEDFPTLEDAKEFYDKLDFYDDLDAFAP